MYVGINSALLLRVEFRGCSSEEALSKDGSQPRWLTCSASVLTHAVLVPGVGTTRDPRRLKKAYSYIVCGLTSR